MNVRECRRVETRKRLIEKGGEVFSRLGVARARAMDIAKEADVAVGTLYLHFESKQGLLRAILHDGADDLLALFRRGSTQNPSMDIMTVVGAHIDIMVRFAKEHLSFCRILFDPESIRIHLSAEIVEYLVSRQEVRLQYEISQGLLNDDIDPAFVSHAIGGMLSGVFDWLIRNPNQGSHEKVIKTLACLKRGDYSSPEIISKAS